MSLRIRKNYSFPRDTGPKNVPEDASNCAHASFPFEFCFILQAVTNLEVEPRLSRPFTKVRSFR